MVFNSAKNWYNSPNSIAAGFFSLQISTLLLTIQVLLTDEENEYITGSNP